jgi:sigma 54 modulation/S30EA-like ribosomal protein
MRIPVQISFTEVRPSVAVQAAVRGEVAALERYFSGIVSCRVVVGEPHRHQRRGHLYQVKIFLTVPGDELVVSHERSLDSSHVDVYQAVRDAFGVARRELEDYVRRLRREVKTHLPMPQPA